VLASLQEVIVAVATDRAVRRRFARDRDAVLASYELGARELAALRALPIEAIDRYAASLELKRWGELGRVVPRTLRVVPTLPQIYRRWLGAHPAPARFTVLSPGASEGLRALGELRAALADDRHADYAADLVTYEVLAAASREDGEPRGFTSRFAIHEVARAIDRGGIPIDPDPAPHAYRFARERVQWRPA